MSDEAKDEVFPHLDLVQFTKSLIKDLEDLRSGKISVQQARASAELGRQVIRAMHLMVTAQKMIEAKALPLPVTPTP